MIVIAALLKEGLQPSHEQVHILRSILQRMNGNENMISRAYSHARQKKELTKSEKTILSIVSILFFIAANAISLSHLPENEKWLIPKVRPYAGFFGLEQNWTMFSPNPRNMNFHTLALITFQDGATKMYEYPRMDLLDWWQHFRREKLRKLFYEYMPEYWGTKYRPSLAKHLLDCNADQKNPPKMVTYIFNYADMPRPDPEHWVRISDMPSHSKKSPYFVYFDRVRP